MKAVFLLLILFISAMGFSQASATAIATVTILKPLSITKEADMNLAEITINKTSGSFVLSPDNSITFSERAALPVLVSHRAQAASFTIQGEVADYAINLPQEILLINGDHTLKVNDFTHNSTGTLEKGAATVQVRATLYVYENQKPCTYQNSGDFRITVQYK